MTSRRYFVFPFRFSAQRFFIKSESFFRPAAVKWLPRFCFLPELCGRPADPTLLTLEAVWLPALAFLAVLFISAYLRFIASEIFLRAAALIVFFLGGAV